MILLLLGVALAAPLRVLAAASLTDVLPRVAAAWPGPEVVFDFAGTSRLAAQLEAGAPADLFFSADVAWMDRLVRLGLVDPGTRRDLLGNRLVVVVPLGSETPWEQARRLALAGEAVPVGRYARQALGTPDRPVLTGDNVRTVLAWVARGEADAGVVYATDARVEPRVVVVHTFPDASHDPIVYPVAVTAGAAQPEAAAAFVAHCAGPARPIFEDAGFTVLAEAR